MRMAERRRHHGKKKEGDREEEDHEEEDHEEEDRRRAGSGEASHFQEELPTAHAAQMADAEARSAGEGSC